MKLIGVGAAAVLLPFFMFLLHTGAYKPWRWMQWISYREHNGPIEFYGKVVDQQNKPIVGARVLMTRQYTDFQYVLTGDDSDLLVDIPLERTTGADGSFSVSGLQGSALLVDEISATGYHPYTSGINAVRKSVDPQGHYYFTPKADLDKHVPNAALPVVYRLERSNGKEGTDAKALHRDPEAARGTSFREATFPCPASRM